MKKISILLILITTLTFNARAQVVINEFSASNLSTYVDNHSDYNDWIELYNAGASAVNLGGYYLSDDSLNNTKWQMPSTINIQPSGFLRFWASGRNEVAGTSYHTNFTLKQTKNDNEWVVLSDPSGNRIDMVELARKTQLTHSYGRIQNGAATWGIFTSPTINASNNSQIAKTDYTDKPDFDIDAGFYPSAVTVTITSTDSNATIRYTLDGTLPTITSAIYTTPINIATTKVLKAKAFSSDPAILPSFIRYSTYFINVSHTLPVMSVSASLLPDLANDVNQFLRPHGSFEYFNDSLQRSSHTYGEFNKHGQDSWVLSQRSLDFVSRDEMGYNHALEEVVFNTSPLDSYQRLILRASGDDNYPADNNLDNDGSAHIRDAFIQNLTLKDNLNVDVRRGSKCIVYLNGTYWGVYDLRDNPDDHDNTEYYYGQDKYNLYMIKTWGNTWQEYGGAAADANWTSLYSYIMSNSMATQSNYNYVADRLDVTSLVDYIAVNMFTVCSDWLNYNTCWWRGLDSTGTHLKWGYQLWDNDATFGHYINYTGIPNTNFTAQPCDPQGLNGGSDPEDHIGILNKLRQNPGFNQYYITRMIDLWNTTFSCDNMLPQFDSTVALIDPEMQQHITRWPPGTYSEWQTNVTTMRNFIINRCTALSNGFMNCYSLTGPHNLTVTADPIGAGNVKLNSLLLTILPWSGTYFGNIQTLLEAQPIGSNSFSNWSSNSQVFNPNATAISSSVTLNGTDSIVAHFLTTSINDYNFSNASLSASPTIFNNETIIEFGLPKASAVSLQLYSSTGKFIGDVMTPVANQAQGTYNVSLNLSKSNLASGMYFIKLSAGKEHKTIKIIYNK